MRVDRPMMVALLLAWRASSYVLVESAGGRYTVLQEWPLFG
jgi:hypothetical protein